MGASAAYTDNAALAVTSCVMHSMRVTRDDGNFDSVQSGNGIAARWAVDSSG